MSPEQSIAHYRIVSKLGEGGMGTVYRATDTKLNRDVAIKVLPDAFANDPDRLARFTREAQVLASLNHPNIAAIYGVEERAIIMELVEGVTLSGPITPEETLPIARQIAEALEYAHERGIVHRDLKPANIKVTPEGRVKVLDFGLAKALAADTAVPDREPGVSPTLTMRATQMGVIMGTAAYMSPEQARGLNIDRRADIWAFGVILHEILTGRRLFEGPTISDTLAAVLTKEPDLGGAPARFRRLLQSCLEKDPKLRLRDIGDWSRQLEEPQSAHSEPRRRWLWPAVATILAVLLIAAAALLLRSSKTSQPFQQFSVDLGRDLEIGDGRSPMTLSPDGTRVVFVARGPDGVNQLVTRRLDEPKSTPLAGTRAAMEMFFSPDSRDLAFFAEGKLKRMPVQGGAVVSLCDAVQPRGGSWGENGEIVAAISNGQGLSRIPSAGGPPRPLTEVAAGEFHRWPQVLPGGKAVLFSRGYGNFNEGTIEAAVFATGQRKTLWRGGFHGRYLPSGHLVYVHDDMLFAVAMDLGRLEVTGQPVPVLPEVASNQGLGAAALSFSETGTLAYVIGRAISPGWPLLWLDSSGKATPLRTVNARYTEPNISPDGKRLAFSLQNYTGTSDIAVFDWQRDIIAKISATPGLNDWPVWTPDGKAIVYRSTDQGMNRLFWIRADGASAPVRLAETSRGQVPHSFSPDGKRLAYTENGGDTQGDLWTLPIDWSDPEHPRAGQPEVFLRTPSGEIDPAFSPDGRWIAYSSDEEAEQEIYVRPFPPNVSGGKWKISSGGGRFAIWSRAGRELFYEGKDSQIMVVAYTVKGADFIPDKPRPWSGYRLFRPLTNQQNFDLAPDGRRFVVYQTPRAVIDEGWTHVNFLLNFFGELKRRVPVK